MKARLLKKILNDTGYTVNNNKEYIAVGSPLCHDLISINKKTLKLKYALDTWREGRAALAKDGKPTELLFIWDKLQELIDNGQIRDIIEGDDIIENPLPVFTVEDGSLIETTTDKYGYPNTTVSGDIMYENTHFPTKLQAIMYGIEEHKAGVSIWKRRIAELEKELAEKMADLQEEEGYVKTLEALYLEEKSKNE